MSTAHDSVGASAQANAVLVEQWLAKEEFKAPRARFDAVCYEAKPGRMAEVIAAQADIAQLRAGGRRSQMLAEQRHQAMCRDLMQVKWKDHGYNLVTTVGKNDLLDKYFNGSSYTAAWFCGLISSVGYSAVAVGDTMASHAGWNEAQGVTNLPDYTGNRPALAFVNAASAGVKSSSTAASFTFTSAGTIKGMFNNSVTTKNGTTGVLYNAVLFTGGDQPVVSTNVVNVSVSYTIT